LSSSSSKHEVFITMKFSKVLPLIFYLLKDTNASTEKDKRKRALYDSKRLLSIDPDKIVGGDPVNPPNRYPYQVSITSFEKRHFCGGSLIAPGWVLSAAHCAGSVAYAQIGRYDLSDDSEVFEDIRVDYVVIHPEYESTSSGNDFMLVRLKTDSQYPPASIDDGSESLSSGTDVTVMGWGTTSSNGPSSDILLEVEVDVVTNNSCNDDYDGLITDTMICAARQNKDSCQGDSGGPLIVKGNDDTEDVVVGVVSWGYGCADSNYPGVYARVSAQYDWIASYVVGLESPTSSPTSSSPTVSPAPTRTCLPMIVEIKSDKYGDETRFEIVDPDGDIVEEHFSFQNNKLYTFNYCLPPKCTYTFTIYDSYGDGICCEEGDGYYSVTYNGDEIASGGEFGTEAATNFGCVATSPPAPSPTLDCTSSEALLEVYLKTDNRPRKINWKVYDTETGNEIVGVDDYTEDMKEEEFTYKECVNRDICLEFEITKRDGGGICCSQGEGEFIVEYDGVIVAEGGDNFDAIYTSPTFGCESSPTDPPAVSPVCVDSTLSVAMAFEASVPCEFVSVFASSCLCDDPDVRSHCISTCDGCDEFSCVDSTADFYTPTGAVASCAVIATLDPGSIADFCEIGIISNMCRGLCEICG